MNIKSDSNKKTLDVPKPKKINKTVQKKDDKVKARRKVKDATFVIGLSFIILGLSIIGSLGLGVVGLILNDTMRCIIGSLNMVVFGIAIASSIYLIFKKKIPDLEIEIWLSIFCLSFAIILVASVPSKEINGFDVIKQYFFSLKDVYENSYFTELGSGGIVGALLYSIMSAMFSRVGTYVVICILFIASGVIYFSTDKMEEKEIEIIKTPFNIPVIGNLLENKNEQKNVGNKHAEVAKTIVGEEIHEEKAKMVTLEMPSNKKTDKIEKNKIIEKNAQSKPENIEEKTIYKLPSLNLLANQKETQNNSNNKKAAVEAGVRLIDVLNEFGINAKLVETHIGPSVTKFEIKPETGIKVNRISNLQNDIKMALAAKDIRIEAPIPSKNAVGVEIPNVDKTIVGLKELLRKVPENQNNKKLLFALGKDLSGQPVYGELNKMPHLLIAGATGSGKSVCVNSIITSLLMRTSPDEVKMLLIDPKKVEFTCYQNIPHLIGPIINEPDEASAALKVIVEEMDRRYKLFAEVGVRNISGYNDKCERFPEEGHKKMPWIVVIIDELADLMLVAAKEVEASIQRITQLARAAGIHLVVATQRPSVDVITGLIKANIPSRIGFAVSSAVDSRTILDQQGAERLLGMGDMLYIPAGEQHPIRVQGVYVGDDEVNAVCEFASRQCRPQFDEAFIRLQMIKDTVGFVGGEVDDPLYEDAKDFIVETQRASTSLLQRKFSIGYQRAARLIDLMEENGVVGPARGSKPREVYFKKTDDEIEEY